MPPYLRLALAAALAGAALAEPQSTSIASHWRYAHPDAKFLFGLDFRAVANSALGQRIRRDLDAQMAAIGAQFRVKANRADMALLNGVDRAFVSAPSLGGSGQPDFKSGIIVLTGTFNLPAIRTMAGENGGLKGVYRGVELWTDSRAKGDVALAMPSPQILIAGHPKAVRQALDGSAASAAMAANPLFRRAMEMAPKHDIWLVSASTASDISSKDPTLAIFNGVHGLEAGVSLQTGFQMNLNLNTESEDAAARLAAGIQAMMQLAAATQQKEPMVADLMSRLRLGQSGSQVQATLSYSQPELDRLADTLQLRMKAGSAEALAKIQTHPAVRGESSWDSAPPQPEPPKDLKVRIFNSEGGPRIVDLPK